MELSWRYAWASFLLNSIAHRSFPLPEAIGSFFLAAALYRLLRGIGLRVVAVLGIHILGFFVAASTIVYAFSYRAYPYFDTAWLLAFLGKNRDSMEWLILVIILFLALCFWLAGVALARRPKAYLTLCNRFDYGVAAFFCLFIVKSLLLIKGGIEVRDSAPVLLLFPFFIFSLLAIGLAKTSSRERREFLAGYSGIGVLASFILAVLAFGAGLVLFLMTYLSAAAEAGYGVLKSVGEPLGLILVRGLLFLFGKQQQQGPLWPEAERDDAQYIPSGESSGWSEQVQELLAWGLFGLGLLIGLILCALATWYLMRWLLSRTAKEKRKQIHWQLALVWVQNLWAAIGRGAKWAVQRLTGHRDTVQLYRAFLKWGRRSGLPQLLSETPDEYGLRLTQRFPALAGEIGGIVNAFNLVVYGEVALNDAQLTRTKLSWRRMRSPRYWPARLKSWFFQ
jgi:multisubunit Na+/H+ antiporter MnhF subunit